MGPLLLYPGEVSHLLALSDVLAEHHAGRAAARLAEIERRKASGAPLDDGGGPLAPLPAYEPLPQIEGVRAAFVVLSERRRRTLASLEAAAWALLVAADPQDAVTVAAATDKLFDARRALIREAVSEVQIEEQATFTSTEMQRDDVLDVLERAHLVTPLAIAASTAQELPRGKVWRSGPPPASTSTASTAASAPHTDDQGAAATVARLPTLPVLGTSRTPAPGGT